MKNSSSPLSSINPRFHGQILDQLHPKRPAPTYPERVAMQEAIEGKKSVPNLAPVNVRKGNRALYYALAAAAFDASKIPQPVSEVQFEQGRRWRFDFAWVGPKVALEVEGGVWTHGRHNRSAGFLKDMEKYNRATVLGWRVVRCVPDTLTSSATMEMIKALLRLP